MWATVPFGDLYAEPSRNGLNRPKRVRGAGYKMVNMGELFAYDRIRDEPMECVPMNQMEKEKYGLKSGDLLFARQSLVAEGTGKCSIVLQTSELTTFESHLIRVRLNPHKAIPLFYYYYFASPAGRGNMQSLVMQVAAAGIRGSELVNLPVPYPSLLTQARIAAILSAYDDLIENNTRRIEILEEITRAIYHDWFVKFHFPEHENVEMVDSELGSVPEGWEVKRLGDVLAELESGKRPKGGVSSIDHGVPSVGAENVIGLGRYDYSKEKYVGRDFFESMKKGRVRHKDILLYKDGAQIGRKSMFRNGFPHEECCINEHVFILRTNDLCTQDYLYFWLDQPEMTQNIKNLNVNAAQPGINQSGVKGLRILLPIERLLNSFEETVEPILKELFTLAKKNNVLRRTRDLLLPRLISGVLDVEDLDIDTEGLGQ